MKFSNSQKKFFEILSRVKRTKRERERKEERVEGWKNSIKREEKEREAVLRETDKQCERR